MISFGQLITMARSGSLSVRNWGFLIDSVVIRSLATFKIHFVHIVSAFHAHLLF